MADDAAPLASLSLTHVYYNPHDPVSHACAWLALVPQALCVVYATLVWSTREAEVALMFTGQLGCEAVNFALKRLIKEQRPPRIHMTGGKGYGMPSSHAQFAVFWAVSLSLFLLVRHRPGGSRQATRLRGAGEAKAAGTGAVSHGRCVGSQHDDARLSLIRRASSQFERIERYTHQPWSVGERVATSLIALGLAGLVAWSRIYLGYHTPRQVFAGCLAGAAAAVFWFAATTFARQSGWLAWALSTSVFRWFRMRDLVVMEDLCQAGWEKWEDMQASRKCEKKNG